MSVLWIRNCTLEDAAEFGRVFCRAIRDCAAIAYSDAQRRASWSAPPCIVPEESGHGVATALYAAIEGRARAKRVALLTAVFSGPARRYFLRLYRREIARQESDISGLRLHSYWLEKCLLGNGVRTA